MALAVMLGLLGGCGPHEVADGPGDGGADPTDGPGSSPAEVEAGDPAADAAPGAAIDGDEATEAEATDGAAAQAEATDGAAAQAEATDGAAAQAEATDGAAAQAEATDGAAAEAASAVIGVPASSPTPDPLERGTGELPRTGGDPIARPERWPDWTPTHVLEELVLPDGDSGKPVTWTPKGRNRVDGKLRLQDGLLEMRATFVEGRAGTRHERVLCTWTEEAALTRIDCTLNGSDTSTASDHKVTNEGGVLTMSLVSADDGAEAGAPLSVVARKL